MKVSVLLWIAVLWSPGIALFPKALAGDAEAEAKAIEAIIATYVASGDQQDPELAAKVLHPDYAQFLDLGKGIKRFSRGHYQDALRSKSIGGENRKFTLEYLDITANTAAAKVVITGGRLRFTDYVTLMKSSRGWEIVSITLSVKPDS